MNRLKKRGNTLVVVEHEEAVMRAADCLVDMGPGSGREGRLVYSGMPARIGEIEESLTGAFLSGRRRIAVPKKRRKPRQFLTVSGATRHNLRKLDVKVPWASSLA